MTQQAGTQQFTDADAKALSSKLQELAKTLPKGEQQALRGLLMNGAGKKDDVQGYEWVDVYDWYPYYGWVYEGTFWY
jgi:hypothetical protein